MPDLLSGLDIIRRAGQAKGCRSEARGGGEPVGRVGVIGSSNLDFTVAVPALPRPGETVSGGQLTTSPGGKGANQAVAARRLGAEVRFVTLLGRDPMGDRLHAVLVGEGLPAGSIG